MGKPTIPVILPVLTDSASEGFLLQTSNGTKSFGISPTPRPALSNMPTPETPYGRLLNVMSPYCQLLKIDFFFVFLNF
jgi:hypothetical protein